MGELRQLRNSYVAIAALLLILGAPCAVRAQPPEPIDRTEEARLALRPKARALRREAEALRKREPKRALAVLDAFFERKPMLTSDVAMLLRLRADIQLENFKDADGALDTYDFAREWNATANPKLPLYAEVELLVGEAQTLMVSKKAAGAVELLQTHWPLIVASNGNRQDYSWSRTQEAAQLYFKALDKAGRKAQVPDILEQRLLQSPELLAFSQPDGDLGTLLLKEICDRHKRAKRPEAAQAWSRLAYMTCVYSAPALESATQQLARSWDDLGQTREFGRAQNDAAAPNPLAAIALPALGAATRAQIEARARELESALARVPTPAPNDARASELIGLYLANQRFGSAMKLAWQLAQSEPDSPGAAAQVCRVFKAADLNLVRAGAFLAWTQKQGENPVPAFLKQHPIEAVA